MLFNSLSFFAFFIITTLVYFVLPQKLKNMWLLFMSYIFYMQWNVEYALLMLVVTATTWVAGILMQKFKSVVAKKSCLLTCIVFNILFLCFFKYADFVLENLGLIMSHEFSSLNILLPVGISFYIFQAVGYVVDVYRGELPAERSFIVYALFVSFYPQLVAGPIERSTNLIGQLKEKHYFEYNRVREGLLLMGWGLFQKMVIADRAAILVNTVFYNYSLYSGSCRVVAAICFAIQIYCDFGGYSNIAIGAAKVMGISLIHNFNAPYFAVSIKDFWRRWHVSLSQWFRDYVYIPMEGSRCSKIKKYKNLMCTFLLSGLWHGAGWNYVFWGGYHGICQIIGEITEPLKNKVYTFFKIDVSTELHKLWKQVVTFVLVDIAWIFFRADSFKSGMDFCVGIVTNMQLGAFFADPFSYFAVMGFSMDEVIIFLGGLIILWAVDLKRSKCSILGWVADQNFLSRWVIYISLIFMIMIYGIYGTDYQQTQFIYFQF